jgi:hypothetical protein
MEMTFQELPCGPQKLKTAIAADEICATRRDYGQCGREIGFENLMEKRKSRPLAGILRVLQ